MPRLFTALLLLALPTFDGTAAVAPSDETTEVDRWYAALVDGKPVGWMRSRLVRRGSKLETTNVQKMSVRRGALTIDIEIEETFLETADGVPLMSRSVQNFAGQKISRTMHFADDVIIFTTRQRDHTRTEQFPITDREWLPPAAAERYARSQLARGAKTIRFRTITALVGRKPVMSNHEYVSTEPIELFGRTVTAQRWKVVTSIASTVPMTTWIDDEWNMLKTTMSLGGLIEVSFVAADEKLAKRSIEPPELVARTLLVPDRLIAAPRKVRSATYMVSVTNDTAEARGALARLPDAGYQRVHRDGASSRSVRITVDLDRDLASGAPPRPACLRPSTMINSDHPAVIALARKALGDTPDDAPDRVRARALCRFAHGFMKQRDLSVGFASASEVAETAQGDCTEFGVLLAAMLRVTRIPSRTVSGLVYTESFLGQSHVFGYHMWTQAWIDGRWMDFDAALNPTEFDATHITMSTSAWSDDDTVEGMLEVIPLFGQLSIRVQTPR